MTASPSAIAEIENSSSRKSACAFTTDGRDYVPVFEEQEEDLKEAKEQQAAKAKNANRKVLYYRNPMGLPDISPVPRNSSLLPIRASAPPYPDQA